MDLGGGGGSGLNKLVACLYLASSILRCPLEQAGKGGSKEGRWQRGIGEGLGGLVT